MVRLERRPPFDPGDHPCRLDNPTDKWPRSLMGQQFAEHATDRGEKGHVLMAIHNPRYMADKFAEAVVLCFQLGRYLVQVRIRPRQIRRMNRAKGPKRPASSTKLGTFSGGNTGPSRVKHGCQPSSTGRWHRFHCATAASAWGELTSRTVDEIRPSAASSRMPRATFPPCRNRRPPPPAISTSGSHGGLPRAENSRAASNLSSSTAADQPCYRSQDQSKPS